MQRDEAGQLRKKTVTADDLEKSRREMRTLLLERDLLSAALTKVYEAENEGKITREEREMIAKRYSSQIRDMESKLSDKELIVEVGELEGLRDELVDAVQGEDPEHREQAGPGQGEAPQRDPAAGQVRWRPSMTPRREVPSRASVVATVSAQSRQSEDLERAVERKAPKRDDTEGERRVKAIRDEVDGGAREAGADRL